LAPGASSVVACQAYGFPRWIDFKGLGASIRALCKDMKTSLQALGLGQLHEGAVALHKSRLKTLRNRLNSTRSAVAEWLQVKTGGVAQEFCALVGLQVEMHIVHGLRESLRFLYDLRALDGRYGGKNKRLRGMELFKVDAPVGFFASFRLHDRPIYVNHEGHVFCQMCDVLHPGDLAQWWDHPGLLLWISNAPSSRLHHEDLSTSDHAVGYLGTTRLQSYQAAAAFHANLGDMMRGVVDAGVFVVYWSWTVSDKAWGFDLTKLTKDDIEVLRP